MNYQEVLKKYGTPIYIYNIDILKNRIKYLRKKFENSAELVYAVKANSFIVKEIEELIDRYEICSPGEFDICQSLKIKQQKMVISGVYKDLESIENMIKNDNILKYTVESLKQYDLLKMVSEKYKKKIHVLLRLTSGNQFGMTEEDIINIIKNNVNSMIIIDGIEFFSGTQKHSLKRISKEIDHLIEFIDVIEKDLNFNIDEVEYGPGLPVFYFQDEEFLEDEFLDEVVNIIKRIKNKKVLLEIGRSMVASCGEYLTKVVDLKANKYGNYAILDGGINHLVYYGQTMAMKIPYYEVFPKRIGQNDTYNLCGSLCTINDILVKNILTQKLFIDDVFIFKNVGAYSITEGISLFLSRDLPKVLLYKNGSELLVRDKIKTSNLNCPMM